MKRSCRSSFLWSFIFGFLLFSACSEQPKKRIQFNNHHFETNEIEYSKLYKTLNEKLDAIDKVNSFLHEKILSLENELKEYKLKKDCQKVEEKKEVEEAKKDEMDEAKKEEMEEAKKDLEEAISTIKTLQAELNEVNLLNAKLLYTNKIFKAKSLSEAQKVKVLQSIDKAANVKEAKNIYETLNEALNSKTVKSSIKESVGFASKAVGVAPSQPIVESDAAIRRMQQLAGIIK
jgi:predicted RNase H-like nuclease (RuvC/YqgF family)